jgi:hypothetical protein
VTCPLRLPYPFGSWSGFPSQPASRFLTAGNSLACWLADAVYGQFWDHMREVYTALVIPQAVTNLDLAPGLRAIDLYPGSHLSDSYEVTWRRLAAVLGRQAPWFDLALRDRDIICAWQPGDPPAIVPANQSKGSEGLEPRVCRRQNSLPSGSVRTCQPSVPAWPTSAGLAPGASSRSSSAS